MVARATALPTVVVRQRVHAVPRMPWSAGSRWRARPSTLLVLFAGLWLFGTGEALLVASHLGNTPWTVLAQGVSRHSSLSIGEATFAISAVVLLGWLPLRERPGLGTLANAVVIAVAIDVMLAVLPTPSATVGRLGEVAAAIACIGAGSGFYLTTWLGPGPRDGWMTGLARRTGWPIAAVRLSIELTVLVAGYLLSGRVGVGTVAFALTIGHAVAAAMTLLSRATGRRGRGHRSAAGSAASADPPR
jgi:uncharacterized membrane protein YczE